MQGRGRSSAASSARQRLGGGLSTGQVVARGVAARHRRGDRRPVSISANGGRHVGARSAARRCAARSAGVRRCAGGLTAAGNEAAGDDRMSDAHVKPFSRSIDADLDNSLERLFALLRIKSISADPAFAGDCRAAAEHLARDIAARLRGRGAADRRHPAVVAKAGRPAPAARAVLRPLRRAAGRSARSVAAAAVRAAS